jgi:tight adherence protein C
MSTDWLTMGWIFVAVAGVAFIVLNRVWLSRRRSKPDDDQDPEMLLGTWTPAWSAQIPMTKEGQEELKQDLRAAGYYRRTAVLEYTAVRALLVVVPLIATGTVALLMPAPRLPWVAGLGLAATVLGYSLPRVYLSVRGRIRDRQIARGLPVVIDLLTLCLSAGQNIMSSLAQTVREIRGSHPALAYELEIVEQHTRLHSLEQALQQLADRVHVPEMRNLALLLIQSERLGTDTAQTLLEYSASIRTTLRQQAEARASRASFWMLFPSVFCLFISAAIILIGPTYMEFWEYRRESRRLLESSRGVVNKANAQNNPGSNQTVPVAP